MHHLLAHALNPDPQAQILMGTVGWENEELYYELGTGENDGYTLVRVQLFDGGRDFTKPLADDAQGHRIVCHLNSLSGTRVPPKGTRVYVAVPAGMDAHGGLGVIFAAIEKTPLRGGNIKPDETVIVGPEGSAARIVMKADGTIGFVTNVGNDPSGKTIALTLSPDGFKFFSPYGSFNLDFTGAHLKTAAGPRIDMGGMSIPGLPSELSDPLTGYVRVTAPVIRLNGGLVYLGNGPNYGTAVHAPSSKMQLPPVPEAIMTGIPNQSASVRVSTSEP